MIPAMPAHRTRLCLVTPAGCSAADCARMVASALPGGDVAALIVAASANDPDALQKIAEAVAPVATARGVAVLIHNDTRVAGRTKADGVHIDTGEADVAAAVAGGRGRLMVGAGGIRSRHDAMVLAEANPDYLFFGLLDGDRAPAIFDKALDLAAWWAEVAVIPAVVMGGSALDCVEQASRAGIDFVALRRAVWDDPRGPAAAVAEANARLASVAEAAA
jgi:thiamine-phosphate pyrophosphorylase